MDDILKLLGQHLPSGLDLIYRIFWCLILFFVGRKVIKAVQKMADRSFERVEMETGVRKFLNSFLYFGLYAVLLFVIAGQIGIDSASIVAILGSAGLALGLAMQESLKNFAGGVQILLTKPFKVGDYIVTEAGEGTVSMIGLVYTTMMTTDNRAVVVPNGMLSNSPMTNVTGQDKRRVDVKVSVDYDANIKKVRAILIDTFEKYPSVLREEPIKAYLDQMLDSYGGGRLLLGEDGGLLAEQMGHHRGSQGESGERGYFLSLCAPGCEAGRNGRGENRAFRVNAEGENGC